MRKLLFLFLMIPFLAISQEKTEDADRIYWSDWYRLEWSDFEGEEEDNDKVAALSSIGLPYGFTSDGEGVLNVNINVCFIRSESWYKRDQEKNVLLQHEQ